MGFFSRLFGNSDEERLALAAEAAGDYAEAAKHWALAGVPEKVADMHLLRAERATAPADEIAALRDALRWAPVEHPARVKATRKLAAALLARVKAEGLATEKDREQVREAARLFEEAGEHADAGSAWELAGDDDAAAKAFARGGHVDRMEQALARDEKHARQDRRLKEAFEEHELHMRGGDRESARAALARCVDLADDKGEYRRLLADLDARRLADGRVSLSLKPSGRVLVVSARDVSTIGRDASCDLSLRAGGVSRTHVEIVAAADGFRVRDAGSRNGTSLAGLPVAGELPLEGSGELGLGDDCALAFHAEKGAGTLLVEVARGLDKGVRLLVVGPGARAPLAAPAGLAATLSFRGGRPYLEADGGRPLRLNGGRIARGAVQLVKRDVIVVEDDEVEVL